MEKKGGKKKKKLEQQRPMTEMSQDAVKDLEQLTLNDDQSAQQQTKTSLSSITQQQHSSHLHRHHHQVNATRLSRGVSEEKQHKSVSLLLPSSTTMRKANDQPLSLRAAAVVKDGNDRKTLNTTKLNSLSAKTVSCDKSSCNQLRNHSFLWKQLQERRTAGIRSKEPERKSVNRTTSVPMDRDRKSSASFSLPTSSSSETNATTRVRDAELQQQNEKPFRISAMGYDSRYEDLIYESQHCVDDDDVAPEHITQAIAKCRLWLKKHHVVSSNSRPNLH